MTKDPVCGMTLMEEKAPFRHEYKGVMYYFCGAGCKERSLPDRQSSYRDDPVTLASIASEGLWPRAERFERDPEKYLSGRPVDWIADEVR